MFEALKKWKLKRRAKLHETYQSVFSSPAGEEVLIHICKVGHVFTSTFVDGDPQKTALNEGKRVLALSILKFIKKDHKAVIEMLEKQLQQQERQ